MGKPLATRRGSKRELLRIEGRAVEVTMRLNPRARRLIVKVHPSTGEVTVVAPSQRALGSRPRLCARRNALDRAAARSGAEAASRWSLGARVPFQGIERTILRGEPGNGPVWQDEAGNLCVTGREEFAPRRVLDFLKREARRSLESRSIEFAASLGTKPHRIAIRDTASRWGSCSASKSISFSWRLILAPAYVFDYVVAHEVAHLREMNHGPRFWRLVRSLVADIEAPQAWLRKNGAALHRYAARKQP